MTYLKNENSLDFLSNSNTFHKYFNTVLYYLKVKMIDKFMNYQYLPGHFSYLFGLNHLEVRRVTLKL